MNRLTLTIILVGMLGVLVSTQSNASMSVPDLGVAADFAILGLGGSVNINGEVIINSATSIIGDVGYGAYTSSLTNQKIDSFIGTAWVHSTANFNYTPATYNPTGGILFGTGAVGDPVDSKLNQATADALATSAAYAGMTPTHILGALGDGDNRTVVSEGHLNVISLTSLNYKSDALTLQSRPGLQDFFVFNVSGNFNFAQSDIVLDGTTAGHVLFNFLGTNAMIDIKKDSSVFYGTILAPSSTASVEYHNPATFEGAIIAYNIDLHSDFNLTHVPFIPAPGAFVLGSIGIGIVGWIRRRNIV